MINILVVEDDKDLNNTICKYLTSNGFWVRACFDVTDAYNALYKNHFDLVVSDIMMPGLDGYDFAKSIRQNNSNIPILFMTAKDDLHSKRLAFSLGIDDYMVKPIGLEELVMRINALLRRAKISSEKELVVGNLILNLNEVTATVDSELVNLTYREFQILFKLLSYPRRAFTRSQLLDEFNGMESDSSLRTVDVHIANLRSKFSECHAFEIVTVRNLGYKAVIL